MTSQENAVEAFPIVPIAVFFGGLIVLLVIVFGVTGSPDESPATIVAVVSTSTPVVATATPTPIPPRVTPTPQTVAVSLDPEMVAKGETVYQGLCAACHGFNARGIQGLGKTLVDSSFINDLTDDELHAFMLVGRGINDPLNTTGQIMPAKGGNPSLTDDDLYNVIAYIRSLNGAQLDVAAQPTTAPTESGPRPTATEFVAPSLNSLLGGSDATDVTEVVTIPTEAQPTPPPNTVMTIGQSVYMSSCAGCHGVNGEGVPFTGSSLVDSEWVLARDGMAIINLLTAKHPPVDPRVAYPHPYRGGYPELSDQQIYDILTYLYALAN